MKLYTVRHGNTDFNTKNIYNGRIDEDINDTGIIQAEKVALLAKDLPIDLIFCSPLLRTRHTCSIINTKGLPVIYDQRLIERCGGEIEGKCVLEMEDEYDAWWNIHCEKEFSGAEKIGDVLKRISSLLEDIKTNYPDKNVLFVSHGGALRCLNFLLAGFPSDGRMYAFKQSNCEIKEYII